MDHTHGFTCMLTLEPVFQVGPIMLICIAALPAATKQHA